MNITEKNNQVSSKTNQETRHNSAQVDIEGVSHRTSQSMKSLKTSMIGPVYLSTTDKPYDGEVGLLIGYNCPQALAPKDHILGSGNKPFAQQTELV